MALTQISTQGIKDGTITGSDLATNVDLVDNQKIRFGTGNDLQIFHDGNNSFINEVGTGGLYVRAQNTFNLQKAGTSEFMLKATTDGAVELFYDNSKKFETTQYGVNCTASLDVQGSTTLQNTFLSDNDKLNFGGGNDLQIYHDGSNSYIQDVGTGGLIISSDYYGIDLKKGSEYMGRFITDGQVELYHDNSKKFETTSSGVTVSGDNSTGSILKGVTRFTPNDSTTVKVMWDETGFSGAGHFQVKDGVAFTAGNSSDLKIYHDGSSSYLSSNTGNLYIEAKAGETAIQIIPDGAVDLRYNGSKKFETSSAGVTIHSSDDGTTGVRGDFRFMQTGTSNSIIAFDSSKSELKFEDSRKAVFGAGDDLTIKHHGNHSYLDNQTGTLYVLSDSFVVNNAANGENIIKATANAAVELYYDDSKKFETSSEGVKFTLSSNATNRFDQTSSSNNKFQNLTYSRSGNSRGDCSVVAIGEGSSSQGHIKIRTSAGNAGLSGGVELINGNTAFSGISDIRLKNKISDITDALTNIDKIEPIKYSWKYDKENTPHIGVSAQSVNEVYPEVIELTRSSTDESDETDYLSVLHTELIPVCIAAIKELKAKVEMLETEVAALKAA